MKRFTLISALAVALLGGSAFADTLVARDDASDGRNLLLINPGDLFNGVISIEYERALNSFFGITAGFSATAFNGPFNFGQRSYTAFGPELGFRFHFIRDAPRGLWIGPYINAGYVVAAGSGSVSRNIAWGAGAGIGYNFVFGKHFAFQLGLAGGFNDYGDALVWAPRLKLGVGGVF